MRCCCNDCNFKGDTKQIIEKIKILCLLTYEWHEENYSCYYWRLYDQTLSRYERLKLTSYIKDKNKEYEKYLQCVTNAGLVSLLGSIAIFFIIVIVIIGASILPRILR